MILEVNAKFYSRPPQISRILYLSEVKLQWIVCMYLKKMFNDELQMQYILYIFFKFWGVYYTIKLAICLLSQNLHLHVNNT